jgi:hypothetical protein
MILAADPKGRCIEDGVFTESFSVSGKDSIATKMGKFINI